MARSNEPALWSLFAGGGAIAALLVPVHIVLFGLAGPFGWFGEYDWHRLRVVITHPLGKLYLFVLISLPLFHWAHRFRFTLVDIGLKPLHRPISLICYGSAVVGTVWCGWILWFLG